MKTTVYGLRNNEWLFPPIPQVARVVISFANIINLKIEGMCFCINRYFEVTLLKTAYKEVWESVDGAFKYQSPANPAFC